MAIAQYERYVIHVDDKNPIPRVGSGMRLVYAKMGHKWVKIRVPSEYSIRIRRNVWDTLVAHVLYDEHMPMTEVMAILRDFGKKPRGA